MNMIFFFSVELFLKQPLTVASNMSQNIPSVVSVPWLFDECIVQYKRVQDPFFNRQFRLGSNFSKIDDDRGLYEKFKVYVTNIVNFSISVI